ncbi:glycosyltransferase family 4 protein [Polynucleobacter paneuropaeus]|nr:glycosyltransferase family 4 protein [Polynucleobacter paneuropaeus]
MKILVDLKNLALYDGGIAHWFRQILPGWLDTSAFTNEFIFLCPAGPGLRVPAVDRGRILFTKWPEYLPRKLRHIAYDNFLFPIGVSKIKPKMILSPYLDVLLPAKSKKTYSIIGILDLCHIEVPDEYPWFIRFYYVWMMKRNLKRANHVITISQTTRNKLISILGIKPEKISVILNAVEAEFQFFAPTESDVSEFRNHLNIGPNKLLLYTGGMEYRKNIPRLIKAIDCLWNEGLRVSLCISGIVGDKWLSLFPEDFILAKKVIFLGHLDLKKLRTAYDSADAVVFPTFSEGFGRSCLEAQICGTPLACSDIPILREVSGAYPEYFDPFSVSDMAGAIKTAIEGGKKTPVTDSRFDAASVVSSFATLMKKLEIEALER